MHWNPRRNNFGFELIYMLFVFNYAKIFKKLFLNTYFSLRKILNIYKKKKVLAHKNYIELNSIKFINYPDVLIAFQVFNKQSNCKKLLKPFLEAKFKNIVAFSDGCIDNSAKELHSLLPGKDHIVIQANDVHEIKNYKMSLRIAKNFGCKYVLLLQDDDLYQANIAQWIEEACLLIENKNVSIVGGCSGMNLSKDFDYIPADSEFTTAYYNHSFDKNGQEFYMLGKYEMGLIPRIKQTNDLSEHIYVACVNRSPQLISVDVAMNLDFFPESYQPYQYDDYFNCFVSWVNNYKVVFLPYLDIKPLGIGGMRLFNNVNKYNRPKHFARNWNLVLEQFGNLINSGKLQELVDRSNLDN